MNFVFATQQPEGFRDPQKNIHMNGKESWVPKGTNNKKVMLLNAFSCYIQVWR